MGLIDVGQRIARNAWRIPGVGQVLAADYERAFARRPRNRFRGVYATFAEAEASIPDRSRIGYDSEEMAGLYRHRMEKANQSDYGPLFWLRGIMRPDIFVFDFGGHVGVSYHGWRRYLGYPPGTRWLVYDVPTVIRVGAELAAERDSPGLAFTSEVADARGCDVFFSAGALQYVDEPLPSILDRVGSKPAHILLNKMPVYDGASFVTVQSTGRAFHAYRIYNRDELVRSVTARGYRLVDDWANREQSCTIPFTRGRDIDAYSGFYFVSE